MMFSVVTGGNRGIGLELCRQLSARGDSVVAVCRTVSPALSSLNVEIIDGVDVAADSCDRVLREKIGRRPIGLLVNNAGLFVEDALDRLDFEGIERQLIVNSMGPLRITHALLENLGSGSKVAIVTSRMGSIEDNSSGGYYGYRMSKAAVNAAGKSLSVDLAPRGVVVVIVHPGYVRTDMTGGAGYVDPPESVRGILARIDEAGPATTGRFVHANGEPLPW